MSSRKSKALVVRPRASAEPSVARAVGSQLGALAASVAAGKCPMCRTRPATTQVQLGPVFTKICEECSKPLWHAMGLMGWLQGALGGRKK